MWYDVMDKQTDRRIDRCESWNSYVDIASRIWHFECDLDPDFENYVVQWLHIDNVLLKWPLGVQLHTFA